MSAARGVEVVVPVFFANASRRLLGSGRGKFELEAVARVEWMDWVG